MKRKIIKILRKSFPFIAVIILWRLSVSFWNPAGILAMIPIFFCSFVYPIPCFAPFSIIFCFLIDYRFDTPFYWTIMYCLFYSINGFQNLIDLTRLDKNAIKIFMMFFGTSITILFLFNFNIHNMFNMFWLFAWIATLYIPITMLIKKVYDDR